MVNGQGVELLAMCGRFFEQELAFNETLYCIATWAFGLAIGLAVLQALITIYKYAKASDSAGAIAAQARGKGALPVSPDMVKAITEFIAGLAKAPVWFFLFIAGLLLIWVATVDVPDVCEIPFASGEEQTDEVDTGKDNNAGEETAAPAEEANAS